MRLICSISGVYVLRYDPPLDSQTLKYVCRSDTRHQKRKGHEKGTFRTGDPKEMIMHLFDHRLHGCKVPDSSIQLLDDDIEAWHTPKVDFEYHFGR